MRKPITIKMQWHVIAIIAIIFTLSIASWLQFVKSTGSLIMQHFSDKTEAGAPSGNNTLTDSAFSIEETQDGQLLVICSSLDTFINKVDSVWSVYKQSVLSKIDSRVTYYGIGEISSVQVVAGSDKWLFYKSKTDGNPIADFEGTNRYTMQEMENIAQSALVTQNGIENRGIKFAIVVAPNKENVYWENMPDTYVHAEKSSTDMLIQFLQQKGVNIISPKSELLDNHLSSQLYYYYDTHWNQLGAYIGVRDVLLSWNIFMPELSDRIILSKELSEEYHYCAEDDLALMAGLRSVFSDEKEYVVAGTVPIDWTNYKSEQKAKEISHYYNEEAVNKESVFLVGDSFRTSMLPALGEQFADVYVVHRYDYIPEMLDEINPSYLIAEYVERHSNEIGKINSFLKQ